MRTYTKLRGMPRDESGPQSWLLTSRQSNATEEHFYRKLEHEALQDHIQKLEGLLREKRRRNDLQAKQLKENQLRVHETFKIS